MEDYNDEDYWNDLSENEPAQNCPNCQRTYNDIDYDYQCCSKCGWDEETKTFGHKIEPTDADFLAGEADIITGRWY